MRNWFRIHRSFRQLEETVATDNKKQTGSLKIESEMNEELKKQWFCIEYSPIQKCMHIEYGLIRQPSYEEWELIEKFYGTPIEANTRANKVFDEINKKQKKDAS